MIHEEISDNFDIEKWHIPSDLSRKLEITKCNGVSMLGGYGQLSSEKIQTTLNMRNYNYE
jgi:hypothetical protein